MKKIILFLAMAMSGYCTYAQVYDTGTNVGIGTPNPSYKLDIYKGATGSALNITGSAVGTRNDVGMDFSAITP
jgi:hypothetical protein